MSEGEIWYFLKKYGRNTNSFLTTYGEVQWFRSKSPEGLIAFLERGHTLIVSGDPLCEPGNTLAVLGNFRKTFGHKYQVVLLLTSNWLVDWLKAQRYGVLEVGKEPFFDLHSWAPKGDKAKKLRSAINRAKRKGVSVECYQPAITKNPELEALMLSCTEKWTSARTGLPIRLFSVLNPFLHSEEKRYFVAWQNGNLAAYVACSPIYSRNGWYVEDVIRMPNAPYGATEMLISQALESFKLAGSKVATLGISPFANQEAISTPSKGQKMLGVLAKLMEPFYNFQGIEHFKKKFAPSW